MLSICLDLRNLALFIIISRILSCILLRFNSIFVIKPLSTTTGNGFPLPLPLRLPLPLPKESLLMETGIFRLLLVTRFYFLVI